MKQKLFTLFLTLAASIGTIFAWDYKYDVQIGDLYYDLDATNKTAMVTYEKSWDDTNYSGLTTANIPSSVDYESVTYSVTSISVSAFVYCSSLTSITIPNTVTSIGIYAFLHCSGLSVHISDIAAWCGISFQVDDGYVGFCSNPLAWANHLYLNDTEIKDLVIPDNVTSIEEGAFYNCSFLTRLTIGNSVTNIGRYAFENCSGLTGIICKATTPPTLEVVIQNAVWVDYEEEYDPFSGVDYSIPLFVPDESIELYKNAKGWKNFKNILPLSGFYEGDYTIHYLSNAGVELHNETMKLFMPVAPIIEGYIFIGWQASGMLADDGIILQAVYESNNPSSAPAEISVPGNKSQKLIRNGNVYILTDDKTYTLTDTEVK